MFHLYAVGTVLISWVSRVLDQCPEVHRKNTKGMGGGNELIGQTVFSHFERGPHVEFEVF